MSICGLMGFGGLTLVDDEISIIVGALSYDLDTPNAETDRSLEHATAIGLTRAWAPWNGGAKAHFWIHYHFKNNANNVANDLHVLGWGDNGTLLGGVSFQNSTNLVTIQVNGAVVATSATAININVWESLHAEVTLVNGGGGQIDVYRSGDLATPIVSFTGNTDPTGAVAADSFHWHLRQFNCRIANLVAMDPDDATGIVDANDFSNPAIGVRVPTADSPTYAAWTPDSGGIGYTQIDERPSSDSDYVEATAVGQASTFTHDPVVGIANTVQAVKWSGRITRTGSDAGVNVSIRRRQSATDDDEAAVAAPGAGQVSHLWDEKVGGGSWTPVDLDATEFGVLSVT